MGAHQGILVRAMLTFHAVHAVFAHAAAGHLLAVVTDRAGSAALAGRTAVHALGDAMQAPVARQATVAA